MLIVAHRVAARASGITASASPGHAGRSSSSFERDSKRPALLFAYGVMLYVRRARHILRRASSRHRRWVGYYRFCYRRIQIRADFIEYSRQRGPANSSVLYFSRAAASIGAGIEGFLSSLSIINILCMKWALVSFRYHRILLRRQRAVAAAARRAAGEGKRHALSDAALTRRPHSATCRGSVSRDVAGGAHRPAVIDGVTYQS